MDWQWVAVTVSVTAAAVYVARRSWRAWAGRTAGCGGGCSCPAKETAPRAGKVPLIPPSELTARFRRR
jgi:hypothetical protein